MDQTGKPARWAPPLPVTARWAACFAALLFMQPSYTLLPGSIVADRNSIRKLLDFVSGKRSQYDWQIDAQMMKGTIFLTRWENDPSQHVIDRFYDGYGKSFEKAFLEHGVGLEDSSSHHRIVSYELGGMRWILQFEADGYLVDNDADYGFATDQGTDVSVVALPLSKRVDAVSLNSNQQYEMLEGVKVIRRGSLVSPDSIIEARTRKNGSKSPSGDESTSILVLQDESHV
ncbi:uncharacterized protein LY89DRAFT_681819 [Mollisia scopiformis]|uniref:Uncharacterized protein n=1 Tax=Mollisia scopiformis TaxID=149040 RepID=A0A194XNB6_MOLSC|nr:uncharacterized protein LY89DRAFT_681819 [Mollisia scopiformis]KUJ21237.1 hypothetical protein LY89DRAFT_681819 [Mollisia scopiformis]